MNLTGKWKSTLSSFSKMTLKEKKSYIFLALNFIFCPMVLAAESKSLTLLQAQEMALNNNSSLKALKSEVEADEASALRTWSLFLPKLGVESRYEHINSSFQKQSGGTANVFAELNLFNGFQDYATRKVKKLKFKSSQVIYDKKKMFLAWEVEEKFNKLLSVNEAILTYEESIKRNENQKAMAKNRKSAGLASEADVLEFDLYESVLQSELSTLQGDLKEAQTDLRQTLGLSENEVPAPQGKLIHFHIDESLESVLRRLPIESSEVIVGRMRIEQAEAEKTVVAGSFLPQVNIFGSYGSRGLTQTEINPESYFGIVARWELFSGFDTYLGRKEAHAKLLQSEAQSTASELSALATVEQGMARLKALEIRVDLETKNKERAARYFKTVADEYRRGVKNSPDMRSASEQLLQVNLKDIQYRYEFFEQKTLVQKAIGGEIKVAIGLHNNTKGN